MNSSSTKVRIAALATAAILAGCSSNPTKEQIGTVSGAVVGGIVGSALTGGSGVGTVGGAAAGSYIGNRIGSQMR